MPDTKPTTLTPEDVLNGGSPCVLTAVLAPVAGLDRFQPAGFPEVGHVIYKAPSEEWGRLNMSVSWTARRAWRTIWNRFCMRGAHDYDLAADLSGMPYLRCVTRPEPSDGEGIR